MISQPLCLKRMSEVIPGAFNPKQSYIGSLKERTANATEHSTKLSATEHMTKLSTTEHDFANNEENEYENY